MVGLERGTVTLSPYQPEWKQHYEEEVKRLESIAGNRLHGYEHIGSTAVEGLAAKPIIDLLAVVDDLDEARATLVPVLEEHGYEYRPNGDVRGRLFFAKGPRTNRTHYLSLTEWGSEFYVEKLAFRDYLQANSDIAAEYESLKQELADEHPNDRDAYTEQKGMFIECVLEEAISNK
ncbi:MAG TPA: GrpB family protein [Halococcus sp.]|nr:GrpB family protein [Halococcus sp.]